MSCPALSTSGQSVLSMSIRVAIVDNYRQKRQLMAFKFPFTKMFWLRRGTVDFERDKQTVSVSNAVFVNMGPTHIL